MRPTTIAVCAAIALCAATYGCGSTPVAEASGSRYKVETLAMDQNGYGYADVVTDTETGQAWLVAWTDTGGVAIERMSPYVSVGMSDDRGE